MNTQVLGDTIQKMMTKGKGILAIDESVSTADSARLRPLGIEETEENRRRFRDLFLTTENIETYLSGVILYDETMRQMSDSGKSFVNELLSKDIVIGIKVDEGAHDDERFPHEKVTAGLSGLASRLHEYYEMGARFAKWRAVIAIDSDLGIPTKGVIRENAERLARYAELCQEANIVPMVEPEVVMEGSHSIKKAEEVISDVLDILFEELNARGVSLPHLVLKTSMVIPGSKSGEVMNSEEVADMTSRVLRENVPNDLGGIVFLSGGQTPVEATQNLNAIVKSGSFPWPITFSYARAIQGPVLEIWKGEDENKESAREKYIEILKENILAVQGIL
jgi:fructose-bisphosphate aldolase class I